MRHLAEEKTRELASHNLAFRAVRAAFIAAVQEGRVFPVSFAHAEDSRNMFALKTASASGCIGGKIGSYWGGLSDEKVAKHATSIFLLDERSGRLRALVEASQANAYRTAAAGAVAASVLARPDSKSLCVFGTGHQAKFEVEALVNTLPIETVHVVGRSRLKSADFIESLDRVQAEKRIATAREGCERADVIVTATTSENPLFEASWVNGGTHISSIGSDAEGKQELPIALLEKAKLYCDLKSQSIVIGEYQHISERVKNGALVVNEIGLVLVSELSGRLVDDEITVFDSSGIALQDLFFAKALLEAADRDEAKDAVPG